MAVRFPRSGRRIGLLALTGLLAIACQSTRERTSAYVQPLVNQEITAEDGEQILVGKIDRTGLTGEHYEYWFDAEYAAYQVDEQTLAELQTPVQSVEFLVFLGTWCSDSQREIPRLYKIADFLSVPDNQLTVIGLDNHPDRYKKSPQHEEAGWEIEYVPTIIVLKDGKEIGRIVEAPQESLEKDLALLLRGAKIMN